MMPTDDTDNEDLDFTKLSFPSDKLTIRDLRRLFPDEFDVGSSVTFFDEKTQPGTLADLLHAERCLAEFAVGRASRTVIGWPVDKPEPTEKNMDQIVESEKKLYTQDLVHGYQKFGLASGPETARQLIREFETAAIQSKVRRKANKL